MLEQVDKWLYLVEVDIGLDSLAVLLYNLLLMWGETSGQAPFES